MHIVECRNCGGYSVDIKAEDKAGRYYDCQRCNFKWFVPRFTLRLKYVMNLLSRGLFFSDSNEKRLTSE